MNESRNFQQTQSVVQDPHFIDIKSKVDNLEFQLNSLCEELGKNVKEFQVRMPPIQIITIEKKQALENLDRSLDDTERICSEELGKFQQTIDRETQLNCSMAERVQEDINHLASQQSQLRIKLVSVDRRITDLESQIGSTPYY